MRNLKKALSLALALVMLLGVMVVGAGAAKFSDVPQGSDNEAAVEVMNAIEIIKGDGNGEFRPNDTLTRAEAAVIISKVLMTPSIVAKIAENTVTSKFADVNAYEGGWAAPYVEACVASQVIVGEDDGNFAPAREVSGAEFAAMLLRVLDLEKEQFSNWPFDWQKAALDIGLDTNNADVFAAKLTRVEAAQMALNALQYSPEGEQTNFVVKRNEDNEILYSGSNETAAYLVLNDANKNDKADEKSGVVEPTASITSTTTNMGSRGQKLFGLVVTKSTDELGRTAVNYRAPSYKLNLTVAEPADYTFKGEVTNRYVYNTVGRDLVSSYTWNVKIDGVSQKDNLKPNTTTSVYQGTEDGACVEVYVKDEEEVVNVFISYYYIGTVSKVVEAKNGDNRYVMINGKSYETEDFNAKDVVVYTLNNNDIDRVALADELTGTLTKIVNNVTFTLDGKTYVCAKNHDGVSLVKNDLGEEITFYIDPMGNIMKVKGAAEGGFTANFLWVVANSSAHENEDYITSTEYPYSYMAYGIKADGTVEEWNIISVDDKKIVPTPEVDGDGNPVEEPKTEFVANNDKDENGVPLHYGMYRYKTVGGKSNSLMLYKEPNPITENIEVNKPGVKWTGGEGLANSRTTFVYFKEVSNTDHTLKNPSVHVGIANIDETIDYEKTPTGVVVDEKTNTVQVVFVNRAWQNARPDAPKYDEAGVAYLYAGSQKKIDWWEDGKKSTRYEYTGIDGNGDEVTLITKNDQAIKDYAGGVYAFDADLEIFEWVDGRQWPELAVQYIRTDAVRLDSVNHSFNITENTTVVDVDNGGFRELNPGDAVVMVTGINESKRDAQVVFVTTAGSNGTERVAPNSVADTTGAVDKPYEMPALVAGIPITISGIEGQKTTNKAYIKFGSTSNTIFEVRFTNANNTLATVTPEEGEEEQTVVYAWNNSAVNVSDVYGFYYGNEADDENSHVVVLTIRNSNGEKMYVETATEATSELFLVNVVNSKVGGILVWNSSADTENTKEGALAGDGVPELTKGLYSWVITVDGVYHSGGHFEF